METSRGLVGKTAEGRRVKFLAKLKDVNLNLNIRLSVLCYQVTSDASHTAHLISR